ncbi:hypothetical protein ABZ595_07385 [Streptomyces rubradiris]
MTEALNPEQPTRLRELCTALIGPADAAPPTGPPSQEKDPHRS